PSDPPPVATDNGVRLTPASRIAFPAPAPVEPVPAGTVAATKSRSGRGVFRILLFLLFVTAVAGAFYGGMIYQRQQHAIMSTNAQTRPSPQSTFPARRTAVD